MKVCSKCNELKQESECYTKDAKSGRLLRNVASATHACERKFTLSTTKSMEINIANVQKLVGINYEQYTATTCWPISTSITV